jgi:hypothetical protein
MTSVIDAPHRVVRRDRDAVRPHREDSLAPRPDEASIPLVDQDRVLCAAEEKDPIVRINRDCRDIGVRISGG